MTTLDTATVGAVKGAVREALPAARTLLTGLVRIPSISAGPPDAVSRCAAETAAAFAGIAGMSVDVLDVGGAPAVVARRNGAPAAATVLLYAHHDVQPTGDLSLWSHPPFDPVEREGRLYGRGAADDKAGIGAHFAATSAHVARHGVDAGVNVVVFVEGEEEIGSPTLTRFLDTYGERLRADVVVVADSTNAAVGVPALTTTLRGIAAVDVSVSALDHAVHSGIYGGVAPDPVAALLVALASLWDSAGSVAVQGIPAATPQAVGAAARQRPWREADVRAEAGVVAGGLVGRGSVTDRVWLGPAVAVIGLDLPQVAQASNTLYPQARARVSMRVPPGADVEHAVAALGEHLGRAVPWGLDVVVTLVESGAGFAADTEAPAYEAARWALSQAWGVAPVDLGIGGSIPFIADLAARFPDATVLVTGVEDPDSRAHGVDESLHLGEWERACVAEALLLEALLPDASVSSGLAG